MKIFNNLDEIKDIQNTVVAMGNLSHMKSTMQKPKIKSEMISIPIFSSNPSDI